MGGGVSTGCLDVQPLVLWDKFGHGVLFPEADALCSCSSGSPEDAQRPPGNVPRLLRLMVPRGPTWTSGLYSIVEGRVANGLPLWKATRQAMWMYSMTTGKWGVGGRGEFEEGFQTGAAFVFCDTLHAGAMPHEVAEGKWLHNRPAWTVDPQILVQSWPETITVAMQKRRPSEKFGMQTAIGGPAGDEAGAPRAAAEQRPETRKAGAAASEPEAGPEAPQHAAEAAEGACRLRVYGISEGSLLARWNAEAEASGHSGNVVPAGSRILRVGVATEPGKMQEALLAEMCVEVEFLRPDSVDRPRCAKAQGTAASAGVDAEPAASDGKAT